MNFRKMAEEVFNRTGLEEKDTLFAEDLENLLKEIEAGIVKGYTAGMNDARKGLTGSE